MRSPLRLDLGSVRALRRGRLGRTIGLVSLGILLLIVALVIARRGEPVEQRRPVAAAPTDPLAGEFARCQALGEAGARDAACLAAWAENRRRFLGPDLRPAAPNPASLDREQ